MIKNGAIMNLTPSDLWEMELWEFNSYNAGYVEKQKQVTAIAILTGYYAAYYTNGGRKAKKPNELIDRMFAKKQVTQDGFLQIEKLKKMEEKGYEHQKK